MSIPKAPEGTTPPRPRSPRLLSLSVALSLLPCCHPVPALMGELRPRPTHTLSLFLSLSLSLSLSLLKQESPPRLCVTCLAHLIHRAGGRAGGRGRAHLQCKLRRCLKLCHFPRIYFRLPKWRSPERKTETNVGGGKQRGEEEGGGRGSLREVGPRRGFHLIMPLSILMPEIMVLKKQWCRRDWRVGRNS